LQTAETGNAGNTLFVDQSDASNSLVVGLEGEGSPALQAGGDNSAMLTILGDGGTVRFLQRNSAAGLGTGNRATVNLTDSATALLSQVGSMNKATLNVSGIGAKGSIVQKGLRNDARLDVVGAGAENSITQNGDDNSTAL